MEENKRVFSIQTEGIRNYLLTDLAAGEQLIPYCATLLKNNEIPGLLPMRYQMLDGQLTVKYDISGKIRLGEYMTQRHVSYQTGLMILKNLCDAFQGLPQYFLSIQQCVLDSECVFIGDGLRTFFPCLPIEGGKSNTSLQSFFAALLGNYFATEDRTDFDEMFKWVHKAAFFDLEAFAQKFLQGQDPDGESAAAAQPQSRPQPKAAFAARSAPGMQAAPNADPALGAKQKEPGMKKPFSVPNAAVQKPEEDLPPQASASAGAGVLNIPGGGVISIPNAAPEASPKKKKDEPEKEKKGFWIFGNQKEKNKDPKGKAQQPFPADAGAARPAFAASAPSAALRPAQRPDPEKESWGEGTIIVQEDAGTEIAPDPAGEGSFGAAAPWLEHQGRRVPVNADPFLLGHKNDVFQLNYSITGNKRVSKNHASITKQGNRFMIRDNQSRNGTFLNGQRLQPLQLQELHEGDEIRLCDEVLIFHQG